jgi:hypothetical protein
MKGLLEHWGTWCEEALEGQEEERRFCAPGARAVGCPSRGCLGDLCEEGGSGFYSKSAGTCGSRRVDRLPA